MTPKQKREALRLIAGIAFLAVVFSAPRFFVTSLQSAGNAVGTTVFKQPSPAGRPASPATPMPTGEGASFGELVFQPMAVASDIASAERMALGPAGYVLATKSETCLGFVRRIARSSSGVPASVAGWSEGKRRRDLAVTEGAEAGCFVKAPASVARDEYTTELYKTKRPRMSASPACADLAAQADAFYNDSRTSAIAKGQWLEKVFAVAASKGCLAP